MTARRSLCSLVVASLLSWLTVVGGIASATPRARSSFEINAPSALVGRTVCVERATITFGAPSLDRVAPHARWSTGALACAPRSSASHAHVRRVLLERLRAHVPRTLRLTYDAHAPPRAIDRV